MKSNRIHLLMIIALFSCSKKTPDLICIYPPPQNTGNIGTNDELKNYAGRHISISGEVKKEALYSKKGLVEGKYEYYLYPSDRKEKILLSLPASDSMATACINKKVMAKGKLFHGAIDASNAQQQSRMGYRLDQVELNPEE